MKKFHFLFVLILCSSLVHTSFQEDTDTCISKVDEAKNEISSSCAKQLKALCGNKDILLTLWDSSTRLIRTGLMATTPIDLGNYDECLALNEEVTVDSEKVNVKGKYCSNSWQTLLPKKILEEIIFKIELKENSLFNNSFIDIETDGDASDLIPLEGALCLPDACSSEEFLKIFKPYLYDKVIYTGTTETCRVQGEGNDLSTFELIVTIIFGVIVFIMIAATSVHIAMHYLQKKEPQEFIKAFSMFYNGKKLITIIPKRGDQISCMYGIRFLCICWVVVGHTIAGFQYVPVFNKKDALAWPSQLYSQYIQAAKYAVDTFFFLSGFLHAYLYLKLSKNSSISQQIKGIPLMYLHRYLRLTPAIAAFYFVTVSFWKLTSDGPLWYSLYSKQRQTCVDYWWSYFFYLQNYFPEKEMCWLHTWYLSADMQMFILAPIVLIPMTIFMKKSIPMVISGLSALAIICVGISISISYFADYSNRFDTHSRLSDYLVGIIGGVILHRNKGKHVTINKWLNIVLWALAIVTMLFIALYMNDVSTNPTKLKKSLFFEISRPVWCICVLWIVLSCYFGYGGIVNRFFSNPVFEVLSRLTYCIYITHIMVITNTVGQFRTLFYFSDYRVYYSFCGNILTTLIVSLFWTLAFEGPMIVLDKMLFNWIGSFSSNKEKDNQEKA